MQEVMNCFVDFIFEDVDMMFFVVGSDEVYDDDDFIVEQLCKLKVLVYLVLNKIDFFDQVIIIVQIEIWQKRFKLVGIFLIVVLYQQGIEGLLKMIIESLLEGFVYYFKDQLIDWLECFFVSEIICEKILENYYQEIFYFVEVGVEFFKEI